MTVRPLPHGFEDCTFVARVGTSVVFRRVVQKRAEWLVFFDVPEGGAVDLNRSQLRFRRREALELAEEKDRSKALDNL